VSGANFRYAPDSKEDRYAAVDSICAQSCASRRRPRAATMSGVIAGALRLLPARSPQAARIEGGLGE